MSRANRRFIIGYFLLVVVPTMAIVGILKQEHIVSAPVAVDGDWKLEVNSSSWAGLLCGKSNPAAMDNSLAISQSGTRLALNIRGDLNLSGSGLITGKFLKASLLLVQEEQNWRACIDGRQLRLEATVDTTAEPRTLAGTISVEACSSCSIVEFHANRESLKAMKGMR